MSSEVRFTQVRKLLVSHGWTCSRIRGSHHIFTKEGELPISVPVHRQKVKYFYVRKTKKILEDEKQTGD